MMLTYQFTSEDSPLTHLVFSQQNIALWFIENPEENGLLRLLMQAQEADEPVLTLQESSEINEIASFLPNEKHGDFVIYLKINCSFSGFLQCFPALFLEEERKELIRELIKVNTAGTTIEDDEQENEQIGTSLALLRESEADDDKDEIANNVANHKKSDNDKTMIAHPKSSQTVITGSPLKNSFVVASALTLLTKCFDFNLLGMGATFIMGFAGTFLASKKRETLKKEGYEGLQDKVSKQFALTVEQLQSLEIGEKAATSTYQQILSLRSKAAWKCYPEYYGALKATQLDDSALLTQIKHSTTIKKTA